MDQKAKIERLAQSSEDKLLLAKVSQRLTGAMARDIPCATSFLSPREQALVLQLMGQKDLLFFGGYAGAERAVAMYCPSYLEEESVYDEEYSPIVCLRAEFYRKDRLTHRDFLGSLMGCGVKRETVGDICVGEGSCDFFVLREIAPYVEQNLLSAGSAKLRLSRIPLHQARIPQPETEPRRNTVASLRLDSVISAGFRISRTGAVQHIQAGNVAIDGLPVTKPDKLVAQGSVVTVRGQGKLRLSKVNGQTKKGRISIEIEKYI